MNQQPAVGKPLGMPEGAKGTYRLTIDEKSRKTTFAFPKQTGEMTHGRFEFRQPDDLQKYLQSSLSPGLVLQKGRGSACRRGKYQKVDKAGNQAVTIGDPILDLISDDEGRVFIGHEVVHLTSLEFSVPRYRSGGIRCIDLAAASGALAQSQLLAAARGEGDFTLIEASERVTSFASKNPSQLDFYPSGGGHLRFKAWKKNYTFYWSIGAEVETWGGNFASARIGSRYIDTFYAQTCFVVKEDSDSDSDDDYLDEYEWGVNSPQPKRVESLCNAQFKGQQFSGSVQAGSQCFIVGIAERESATS